MIVDKETMIASLEIALQQVRDGNMKCVALLTAAQDPEDNDAVWYGAVIYAPCAFHGVPELLMPQRMLSLQIDDVIRDNMRPGPSAEDEDEEDDSNPQDLPN